MNNARSSRRWRVAQWLELRWWRRYLKRKSPEAYLTDKRTYWERLLRQLDWSVVDGARVLDAGCGPAGIFVYLHDRQQVTAVDPLLSKYESLAIFHLGRYPNVDFREVALEDYRAAKAYDAVYCLNAINHVNNWAAGLDALTQVSRAGTTLLLTSDVHRHAWLLPLFRLLPGDALHPQQHAAQDYALALAARGWRIDRTQVLRTERIFEYRAWVCTLTPTATP